MEMKDSLKQSRRPIPGQPLSQSAGGVRAGVRTAGARDLRNALRHWCQLWLWCTPCRLGCRRLPLRFAFRPTAD